MLPNMYIFFKWWHFEHWCTCLIKANTRRPVQRLRRPCAASWKPYCWPTNELFCYQLAIPIMLMNSGSFWMCCVLDRSSYCNGCGCSHIIRIEYFSTGLFFIVGFYVRKKEMRIYTVWHMCSSHSGVAEDSNVLACDAVLQGIWFTNVLPSPSRFLWSIHLHGPLNVWRCSLYGPSNVGTLNPAAQHHIWEDLKTQNVTSLLWFYVRLQPRGSPQQSPVCVKSTPFHDSEENHKSSQLSLVKQFHFTASRFFRICGFLG